MRPERKTSVIPGWQDRVILCLARPWLLIIVFAFLLTPCRYLSAALESGAELLNIGIGARPIAMGSAYTAVSEGIDSLYWNPAGLSSMQRKEAGAMYSQWLLDSVYNFIGFGLPAANFNWGFGLTKLSHGSLAARGANREDMGSFDASDELLSVGIGRIFSGGLQLGGAVKYLRSSIGKDSASTFAVDVGAMRRLKSLPLSVGLSVRNLGPGMKYIDQTSPLPLALSAGFAFHAAAGINIALDVRRLVYDRETSVSIGTEYVLLSALSLRGGYMASAGSGSFQSNPVAGLGAGIGMKLMNTQFDYAMTPFGELGNAHRISLNYKF